MKKLPKAIWVTLALIVAIYAAWSIAYPFGTIRYKMTVVVDTPEGEKMGSAVREVHFYSEPHPLPDMHAFESRVDKGEAVVVDLGKRGILFALMNGVVEGTDYGHNIVFEAFPPPDGKLCCAFNAEEVRYYNSLKEGKVTLSLEQYPMFVHFRDPHDPKTVESVLDINADSQRRDTVYTVKADHFEDMFGKGVKLKEVTIEVTDEPVTWGIEKWVPWLSHVYGYISGSIGGCSGPPIDCLDSGDFERNR